MASHIRATHAVRLGLRQIVGVREDDMRRLVERRGEGSIRCAISGSGVFTLVGIAGEDDLDAPGSQSEGRTGFEQRRGGRCAIKSLAASPIRPDNRRPAPKSDPAEKTSDQRRRCWTQRARLLCAQTRRRSRASRFRRAQAAEWVHRTYQRRTRLALQTPNSWRRAFARGFRSSSNSLCDPRKEGTRRPGDDAVAGSENSFRRFV